MVVANFDIATDVKVEFYLPAASDYFVLGFSTLGSTDVLVVSVGSFTLGTSLLGGSDILGDSTTSSFSWQPVEAITSYFSSNVGGEIQNSIYFQPTSATANISMQSWDFDPSVNPYIRPGTKLRLRVDDSITNQTIFTGYIDTINVDYAPDEPNRISITATDKFKRIINSRIPIYNTSSYDYITPLESLNLIMQELGLDLSPQSSATAGKIPGVYLTEQITNTLINEALQVGLGISWIDQLTEELIFIPRPQNSTGTPTTYVVGNDHPIYPATNPYHLCMSAIEIAADQDNVYNSLKVSMQSDSDTYVVLKNQDTIDLYGESPVDVSLNVVDDTELNRWATEVFNYQSVKLVKSVTTPTIDRLGNLTAAAFFTPGTVIGIKYSQDVLNIDTFYTITKVSHSVDVNNWYTTLELWKEV